MKNQTCFILVILIWMTVLTTTTISNSETGVDEVSFTHKPQYPDVCRDNPIVIKERTYGDYQIKISSAGEQFCHLIDITKQGTPLYHDEEIGGHFYFGTDLENNGNPFAYLTNPGVVNLVFSKWTGGMHCCYSLHIFELDGKFKEIANIDGGNFSPSLEDVDYDGIPEIKVSDDFLAYLFSSFADSATGEVILKYSNIDSRYRVATDYMKKPAPDLDSMHKKIRSWQRMLLKRGDPEQPPPSLMQVITNLFYTGNKRLALELVDRSWPMEMGGKEDFLKSYEEALSESKFYREFEEQL